MQAQIVADPSAPGNQRPTVLAAPNGVPLVNIQTPSAAGVSRNTYQQFDVGTPGAVLNNSRTNVPTQLGGWVQGNPWLAGGEARIILNEVNSQHPSHLNGFVEVAGRRAEVIIANPAGIQVNGGGFINASRTTLTTGTPVMNGGQLASFQVQRGTIRIDGAGLNNPHSDYTAILARAIEVNAHVHAQQLHLMAGVSTVNAEHPLVPSGAAPEAQGATPHFALDVSELGGMYAGHIRLIGTEAGVGVRHHGTLAAGVGDVHISTHGWLSSAGCIEAAQHLKVQAQEVTHQGVMDSAHTHIQATTLDNVGTGRIFGDRVSIAAHTLTNREATGDDVTLPGTSAAAAIAARQRLDIGVQHLTNREGALLFSAGELAIGGALDAHHHALTDGSAHAQTLNNQSATIESLGHMALAAHVLRNTNAHFHTELTLISGPESLTLIQPQGSSTRIDRRNLYWEGWSRAGQYRFDTTPAPSGPFELGSTPIPDVLDGDDNPYPANHPVWAHFGLTAPVEAPAEPTVIAPTAPDPASAQACESGTPGFDATACGAYQSALSQFQTSQAAYDLAWAQHQQAREQWESDTEAAYDALSQAITTYNAQFAGAVIRSWTQFEVTQTVSETRVTRSEPGQIIAGGSMTLRGQDLLNHNSHITVGQSLQGDMDNLVNAADTGQRIVSQVGAAQFTRSRWRGGLRRYHQRDWFGVTPYAPADEISTLMLQEATDLKNQAASETDPARRQSLIDQAQALELAWQEGGSSRVALHTLVGALGGGAGGALGAASSQTLIPQLGAAIDDLDVPVEVKQALTQVVAMGVGAAFGGASGAASAQNATAQNYLTPRENLTRNRAEAQCRVSPGSEACVTAARLNVLDQRRDQELAKAAQACNGGNTQACQDLSRTLNQFAAQGQAELQQLAQELGPSCAPPKDCANAANWMNNELKTLQQFGNQIWAANASGAVVPTVGPEGALAGGLYGAVRLSAAGFGLGAGFDAAGQLVMNGSIRPEQSLVAGMTGAVGVPLAARGMRWAPVAGAGAAGLNTTFNNIYYDENTNVWVAGGLGGAFGAAGPAVGSRIQNALTPLFTNTPRIPATGPTHIPSTPPWLTNMPQQIGTTVKETVSNFPSFIPLDNGKPKQQHGSKP